MIREFVPVIRMGALWWQCLIGYLLVIQGKGQQDFDFVEFETEEIDQNRNDSELPVPHSPVENLQNRNQFLEWLLGYHHGEEEEGPELEPVNLDRCPTCTCGIANKRVRIVGGVPTEVNKYVWMVLLMYRGKFYCGATLINNWYLMTAAHCVDGFYKDNISARLMEHDRNDEKDTIVIERNISRIIKHSGYSDSTFNNDIALLRLSQEVKWENGLGPVCLPERGKSFSGHDGLIMGWGVKSQGGATSPVLREVTVPILSNNECRQSKYGARRITENMICAGLPEGKKDACQGDSGGPMHVVYGSRHDIVGVVSWGEGCARPGYPGVYSRVNRYLTWIARNTVDACPCNHGGGDGYGGSEEGYGGAEGGSGGGSGGGGDGYGGGNGGSGGGSGGSGAGNGTGGAGYEETMKA